MISIKKIKYLQRNRVEVTFADGSKVRFSEEVLVRFPLREGQEIDEEQWEELAAVIYYEDCKADAIKILERRLHSSKEVEQKLRRKDKYPFELIQQVCLDLEGYGFLNDLEFARMFSRDKATSSQPWGQGRLKMELRKRGVSQEYIVEAFQELFADDDFEFEQAFQAGVKKWQSLRKETDFYKKKQKLYRFLAGRGYNSRIIAQVAEKLSQNNGDADEGFVPYE